MWGCGTLGWGDDPKKGYFHAILERPQSLVRS